MRDDRHVGLVLVIVVMMWGVGLCVGEVNNDVVADTLRLSTTTDRTLAIARTAGPWHACAFHASAVAGAFVKKVTGATVRAGSRGTNLLNDSCVVNVAR